jgi:hypothetical protein
VAAKVRDAHEVKKSAAFARAQTAAALQQHQQCDAMIQAGNFAAAKTLLQREYGIQGEIANNAVCEMVNYLK